MANKKQKIYKFIFCVFCVFFNIFRAAVQGKTVFYKIPKTLFSTSISTFASTFLVKNMHFVAFLTPDFVFRKNVFICTSPRVPRKRPQKIKKFCVFSIFLWKSLYTLRRRVLQKCVFERVMTKTHCTEALIFMILSVKWSSLGCTQDHTADTFG